MGIPTEPLEEGEKTLEEVVKGEKPEKPKEETKEGKKKDTNGEDKEPKTYETEYRSLQKAVKEERTEKQRLSGEMDGLRRQVFALESLKSELDEHRKSKQAQTEVEEYQKDPGDFLLRKHEELRGQFNQLSGEQQSRRTVETLIQQGTAAVVAYEQAFQSEHSDYPDAAQFLKNWELKEMETLGVPENLRGALLQQKAIAFYADTLQRGADPAKVAYDIATSRGYKPKVAEGKETPAAGSKKAEEQIERLEKGLKAAQSLNKGTKSEEESILKRIEEMNSEEFDAFWKKEIQGKKAY